MPFGLTFKPRSVELDQFRPRASRRVERRWEEHREVQSTQALKWPSVWRDRSPYKPASKSATVFFHWGRVRPPLAWSSDFASSGSFCWMNSSSKYGAGTEIHNKLAACRALKQTKRKNISRKLHVPLCPVSSLLQGLSLHLAQIKRISPWLVGKERGSGVVRGDRHR